MSVKEVAHVTILTTCYFLLVEKTHLTSRITPELMRPIHKLRILREVLFSHKVSVVLCRLSSVNGRFFFLI